MHAMCDILATVRKLSCAGFQQRQKRPRRWNWSLISITCPNKRWQMMECARHSSKLHMLSLLFYRGLENLA